MTEYDLSEDGFQALPLCTALAMAVMEQSGVRAMIDREATGYQRSIGEARIQSHGGDGRQGHPRNDVHECDPHSAL